MYKTKFLKKLLVIPILCSLVLPEIAYGRPTARTIKYDNSGSTLSSTNVEGAFDELDAEKIPETDKGIAGGVATLDGSTKILAVQLPAIAITDVNVCSSQVCQLALTAEEGDVCIRDDEDKSYIHNGGIVGDMTDWNILLSTGLVTSVNGEIGDVVNVERTTNKQTTISDDDSKYPSSGAVVDKVDVTHAGDADAHHDDLSNGLDITPNSVDATTTINAGGLLSSDSAVYSNRSGNGLLNFRGQDTGAAHTAMIDIYNTPKIVFGGGLVAPDSEINRVTTGHLRTEGMWTADGRTDAGGDNGMKMSIGSDLENAGVNELGYLGFNCYRNLSTDKWTAWDNSKSAGILFYDDTDSRFQLYRKTDTSVDWTNGSWDYSNILLDWGEAGAARPTSIYLLGAAGDLEFRLRQSGDADDRFELLGDSSFNWGDGTGATDVKLYRGAANVLKTDDALEALSLTSWSTSGAFLRGIDRTGGASGDFLYSDLAAEANARFLIRNDGQMLWGPGSAARDTNLYRSAANMLYTDDSFTVGGNLKVYGASGLQLDDDTSLYRGGANIIKTDDSITCTKTLLLDTAYGATGDVIQVNDSGNSKNLVINAGGSIDWGSGDGSVDNNLTRTSATLMTFNNDLALTGGDLFLGADTSIGRIAANVIGTTDQIRVTRTPSTSTVFSTVTTGDGNISFSLDTDGIMGWGNGTDGADVDLFRGGVDVLETNAKFETADADGIELTGAGADKYVHTSTTKYTTIHASSFETENSSVVNSEQWGSPARVRPSVTGNNCYAQSSVHFANGSTVTRLDGYGTTSSGVTNQTTVNLKRITLTSNAASTMAACSFSDGGATCNDTSISNATIDNTTYAYQIEVITFGAASQGDAGFYNAKITSTTTNMSMTQ